MKYMLYVWLICGICSTMYRCKNKSTLPTRFNEGEILFRTVRVSPAKIDTHFTLLIIKQNKVKTVYLHRKPHFATIRTLHTPIVQHIHLKDEKRKIFTLKDTLLRKNLILNTLPKLSDTTFWDTPVSRYKYNTGDSTFIFTVMKNVDISPLYLQDLEILQGFVLNKFVAEIKVKTPQTEIASKIIRLEQKDIADIEFDY